MSTNNTELQNHINLVVAELRTCSGARIIAAAEAIETGLGEGLNERWSSALWDYCEALIGEEALQQGYLMDDRNEVAAGPFFGYGRCTDHLDAYCALHSHFGAHWLEKTLMTGCSSLGEGKKLLENAQHNFDNAQSLHRDARVRAISDRVVTLMKEIQRIAA